MIRGLVGIDTLEHLDQLPDRLRQEARRDLAAGGRCLGLIDLHYVRGGVTQCVGEPMDVGR